MRTQGTDALHHCEQPREDGLKVRILDRRRIETKMLPNDRPYRLQVLFSRHLKTLLCDIDLADGFEDVAGGRDGLARALFDVSKCTIEFAVNGTKVAGLNEVFERA